MPKNKKLKIKQKQRQKQNQTVIVKVDNSRKTIRKGDTQPTKPKLQQPIIINNQQPYLHPGMYQHMFPQPQVNKITPPVTNPPVVTAPEQPSRSNIDDAINAFSKTNDDRFKTLQEQLNTMNDNFKQASKSIVERINQPQPSFNQQPEFNSTPHHQQTKTPKPDKTIIINDSPFVSSTPSRGISQLRTYTSVNKTVEPLKPTSYVPGTTSKTDNNMNRLPDSLPYNNGSTPYKSDFTNEIDNVLNEPFKTAKIDSNSQQNRQFNAPKIVPPLLLSSSFKQGPTSQLDAYLQQVDKKNKIQTEDEKIAKFKQEELDALDAQTVPDTKPLEIKKVEDDKPVRDTKADLMKGKFNNYAEEGICPVCSIRYENKDGVHKHLIKHHKAVPDDKDVFVENGKTYKTHRQRDTIITNDGKKSYKFNDVDYEQIDEKTINKIIEDRNREPLEGRNEKNRARMTKTNKAIVKEPANEI